MQLPSDNNIFNCTPINHTARQITAQHSNDTTTKKITSAQNSFYYKTHTHTHTPQFLRRQLVHPQISILAIETRSGAIAFRFAGAASVTGGAQLDHVVGSGTTTSSSVVGRLVHGLT